MTLIVGAYPAYGASEDLVEPVVAGLAASPLVGGLEVPYGNGIELPPNAPGEWRNVVTLIPPTMIRMGREPLFGPASPDADQRRAAVALLAEVRDAVVAQGSIKAVELQSAPREKASAAALAETLNEAASWDWGGATLIIEHCDEWQTQFPVQKGFLSVTEEIDVIEALAGASTPVRLGINWARSVIESHDVATPVQQVAKASSRGVLGALMFSSVADADSDWVPAWVDAHLPPVEVEGTPESSLLTGARIRETVGVAGDVEHEGFLGFKIGLQPASLTAEERVERLLQTAVLIDQSR